MSSLVFEQVPEAPSHESLVHVIPSLQAAFDSHWSQASVLSLHSMLSPTALYSLRINALTGASLAASGVTIDKTRTSGPPSGSLPVA